MKIKAYSLLRVSGKGQIDGDGFPRQRESINKYCVQNNIEIAQEFCEMGISGTKNVFDREVLAALFEALKHNDIKLVLIENSSRLARDLMVGEILLSEMRKLGAKVVACDSDTDLTVDDNDPTKKLIRQILGAFSEFEKSCLISKLRCARQRVKKETGRCEGQPPFGATEPERATIAFIRDLRASGLNPTAIARRLNETGVQPRTALRAGKQASWHPPMVTRILARA